MLRRNRWKPHALMLLLLTSTAGGCSRSSSETAAKPRAPAAAAAVPLRIAAASDLQLALPDVAGRFQVKSGVATSLVFGASGMLAEQIKNGAPFDVFMAANVSFVDDLVKDGSIVRESAHSYARGSLVLVVSREIGDRVGTLGDLTRPEVRKIALANPLVAP